MKRYFLFFITVLCLLFLLAGIGFSENNFKRAGVVRIAAIQFEISEKTYNSIYSFKERIDSVVGRLFRKNRYDLLVFPEYTSALIALIPYAREIKGKRDFRIAFKNLKREKPSLTSIKELFLEESGFARSVMNDVFGSLSRRYNTFIIAGTYFAGVKGKEGKNVLRNRVVVYGPDGYVCYTQDKVFLTDFERKIIGLTPGRLENARGFVVKGRKIAITVCRDTFEEVWSKKYNGYDIWLDIKANGAKFDKAERENFMKALPSRLRECNVRYGITVCLVGRFLDLFWEGESSLIEDKKGKVVFLKKVDNFRRERILTCNLNFGAISP